MKHVTVLIKDFSVVSFSRRVHFIVCRYVCTRACVCVCILYWLPIITWLASTSSSGTNGQVDIHFTTRGCNTFQFRSHVRTRVRHTHQHVHSPNPPHYCRQLIFVTRIILHDAFKESTAHFHKTKIKSFQFSVLFWSLVFIVVIIHFFYVKEKQTYRIPYSVYTFKNYPRCLFRMQRYFSMSSEDFQHFIALFSQYCFRDWSHGHSFHL